MVWLQFVQNSYVTRSWERVCPDRFREGTKKSDRYSVDWGARFLKGGKWRKRVRGNQELKQEKTKLKRDMTPHNTWDQQELYTLWEEERTRVQIPLCLKSHQVTSGQPFPQPSWLTRLSWRKSRTMCITQDSWEEGWDKNEVGRWVEISRKSVQEIVWETEQDHCLTKQDSE